MCDLQTELMEKELIENLNCVDPLEFRKQLLGEWYRFKINKTLEPDNDKKAEDYWKYISMAFFSDPDAIFKQNPSSKLSNKSIVYLNKLNDMEDILKKVIIISNKKHIKYLNVLTEKNVSLASLVVAIRNLVD